MYFGDQKSVDELLFKAQEFLDDEGTNVNAYCKIRRDIDKTTGELQWVTLDMDLSISDGRRTITLPVDAWDSEGREKAIKLVENLTRILEQLKVAMVYGDEVVLALEKEIKDRPKPVDVEPVM